LCVATSTIPIVFTTGGDPVELGLVTSLNRPGGNITGVTFLASDLGAKRLGLLREFAPNAIRIAMLMNPTYQPTAAEVRDLQIAGRTLGLQIKVANASTGGEIDAAFASFERERPDALIVGGTGFCSAGGISWCHWRRIALFPRSIHSVSMSTPAV
jgi:ABC-type uncharacterized transport system substrate-binding protein